MERSPNTRLLLTIASSKFPMIGLSNKLHSSGYPPQRFVNAFGNLKIFQNLSSNLPPSPFWFGRELARLATTPFNLLNSQEWGLSQPHLLSTLTISKYWVLMHALIIMTWKYPKKSGNTLIIDLHMRSIASAKMTPFKRSVMLSVKKAGQSRVSFLHRTNSELVSGINLHLHMTCLLRFASWILSKYLTHKLSIQPYKFPKEYNPRAEDKAFGDWATNLISEVLKTGKIVPLPVKLYPNGLESVLEGLKDMQEGKVCWYSESTLSLMSLKVSHEKITYRVIDTPGIAY